MYTRLNPHKNNNPPSDTDAIKLSSKLRDLKSSIEAQQFNLIFRKSLISGHYPLGFTAFIPALKGLLYLAVGITAFVEGAILFGAIFFAIGLIGLLVTAIIVGISIYHANQHTKQIQQAEKELAQLESDYTKGLEQLNLSKKTIEPNTEEPPKPPLTPKSPRLFQPPPITKDPDEMSLDQSLSPTQH